MEPVEGHDVESEKGISLEDNVSGQPPEEAATATVLHISTSTRDQETEEDEDEEEEEETLSTLGKPRTTGLHIFFLDLR